MAKRRKRAAVALVVATTCVLGTTAVETRARRAAPASSSPSGGGLRIDGRAPSLSSSTASSTSSRPAPVQVVRVEVPGDLPAFVVRASRGDDGVPRVPMAFFAGVCGHPGGYVASFQHTAAKLGDLVAVQGDVPCPADAFGGRQWSWDLDAMDRRVEAAFRAAGLGEPRGVMVIGYSQGAERAEKLVARRPDRYAGAVLVASPVPPSPALLGYAGGVALVAGTRDGGQGRMRDGVAPLARAGVPAAFFRLPGARHGEMGERPEESMNEVLDFVEQSMIDSGRVKIGEGVASHGLLPRR